MEPPLEVTLKPLEDDAAATALYVYATMTGNAELRARLDATNWTSKDGGFDSIPAGVPEDPYRNLRFLCHPDGTFHDLVQNMDGGNMAPVALVVRFVEHADPRVLVKLEVGGSANAGRPGFVISLDDGRSGREGDDR